jgi:hypothetical protein
VLGVSRAGIQSLAQQIGGGLRMALQQLHHCAVEQHVVPPEEVALPRVSQVDLWGLLFFADQML